MELLAVEDDVQHGDDDEQQREQRDEAVVRQQRAVLAASVLAVAHERRDWERERAMPLDTFIEGAIEQLGTDADEILVGPAVSMRANPGPGEHAWVNEFNDLFAAG